MMLSELEYEYDLMVRHLNSRGRSLNITQSSELWIRNYYDLTSSVCSFHLIEDFTYHFIYYMRTSCNNRNLHNFVYTRRTDEYEHLDYDLYKEDIDYRFQIDSAYTAEEIEYNLSRELFNTRLLPYGVGELYTQPKKDSENAISMRSKRVAFYKAHEKQINEILGSP